MTRWMNLHQSAEKLLALFLLLFLAFGAGCESGFSDSPSMEPDNDDDWWNEHKAPFQEEMWEAENPEPDVGYDLELPVDETWKRPEMDTERMDDDLMDEEAPIPETDFESS